MSAQRPLPAEWQPIQSLLQAGLPQAMLAVGESGSLVGQYCDELQQVALCFAPSAPGLSCGICRSCRLLAEGNHPDLLVITAETGKRIAIDSVRHANEFLAYTPQVSARRWLRVEPAEALTAAAANALLKTLEEPAARAHILLLSERPSQLLATIRSRLQKLPFPAPRPGQCVLWLEGLGIPPAEALWLSRQFANRPLRAWQLWESGWVTLCPSWIDVLLSLPQQGPVAALRLADNWAKDTDLLLLRELMLSLLADLLRLRNHRLDSIVHVDYQQSLEVMAQSAQAIPLWETLEGWIRLPESLAQNRNVGMMLETLLLSWVSIWSREKVHGITS
ncbi:MAG: DNA polymerase III subunit delta' C-terminal domain-containing protein [Acidithiobacillus ferrivorans]